MKNLVTAEHQVQKNVEQITIQDLMDSVLSHLIVNEGWTDTPSN